MFSFVNLGLILIFLFFLTIGHDNSLLNSFVVEIWGKWTLARPAMIGEGTEASYNFPKNL